MNQSADDIWRSILNRIEVELETQVNALSSWAEILDTIVDHLEEEVSPLVSLENPPPLLADEILDDIRDVIKRLADFEDHLREFRKTYDDNASNEA